MVCHGMDHPQRAKGGEMMLIPHFFLFIWSTMVLKIVLVGSVVILAIYLFFLQGRYLLVWNQVLHVMKNHGTKDCREHHDDVVQRLKSEKKRLKTLKILWIAISVLSTILLFTFD